MDQALDSPDIAGARTAAGLGFRKDINGLRALAVLGVVAFHADPALVPGGFVGVDIFFVISGFLISRIILSECAAGDFSLSMFYAKRARRILPALLVVVSLVWLVGWFRAAPTQFRDIGGSLMSNSYFTVNFWFLRLANVTGYFGADFVHEAFAASLVAQHRRAVLSRLVGPAAGAFQAEAKPAPARHRMHLRRFAGGLRHPDACRSDRRFLFALDPRMGARPWRDARLSRGLPDRASALPGADWRQYRRRTRDRADARRFVPDERGAAVSGLARRNPDRRLRSRHRASARSARRIGARQQSRRLFSASSRIHSISGTGPSSPSRICGPGSFRRKR